MFIFPAKLSLKADYFITPIPHAKLLHNAIIFGRRELCESCFEAPGFWLLAFPRNGFTTFLRYVLFFPWPLDRRGPCVVRIKLTGCPSLSPSKPSPSALMKKEDASDHTDKRIRSRSLSPNLGYCLRYCRIASSRPEGG